MVTSFLFLYKAFYGLSSCCDSSIKYGEMLYQ